MELINRPEAAAQGLMYYFNNKPCKRGHISKRRVSDWACVACAEAKWQDPVERAKTRKRCVEWRKKNPDRKRQVQLAYRNNTENGRLLHKYRKLKDVKRRGKKNKFKEILISFTEFKNILINQNYMCPLTGRKLDMSSNGRGLDRISIDRIEGNKGYISGNVRFVTWQANSARLHGSDVELIQFCHDVINTQIRNGRQKGARRSSI